jgi:hypothetical protein
MLMVVFWFVGLVCGFGFWFQDFCFLDFGFCFQEKICLIRLIRLIGLISPIRPIDQTGRIAASVTRRA